MKQRNKKNLHKIYKMLGLKSKMFKTFGRKIGQGVTFGLKNAGRLGQAAGLALGNPTLLLAGEGMGRAGGMLYGAGTAARIAGGGIEKLTGVA